MKSFKDFVTEVSKKRLGDYIKSASVDKSHHAHEIGTVNGVAADRGADSGERAYRDKHNEKHKRRSLGIQRAVDKLTNEETIVEVEAPRSENDKKVFAEHPVKTTDYPVKDNGVFTSKTKDKSRKADHSPEESKALYSKYNDLPNPDSESPLYEPQTLGSRQKIMQYFKPESKQDDRTPIKEDVDGTYRASFYGQLKRRMTKNVVPAKPAAQKLTTKIDIDDPEARRWNGNEQGIKGKEVGAKKLANKLINPLLKKVVNEVSYDRLRQYMDKNDNEYNKETDKDKPYDGNIRKRENRSKGFSLATNKRIGKNVKVPSKDE